MKALKLSLVITAAAVLTIGLSGMAYAFHAGGAARCSGCHSMHSALGNHLVTHADPSSTCLSCHESASAGSYHISTPGMTPGTAPIQRSPGGDFAWIRQPLTGTAGRDGGWRGHNIVATEFNYTADIKNLTAPGGTFVNTNLACSSCHDPHGTGRRLFDGTYSNTGASVTASGSTGTIPVDSTTAVGTYDLLYGTYRSTPDVTYLAYPIAVRPGTYNRTEASTQTRVAYGSQGTNTWGRWCGSCHPGMMNGGAGTGGGHTHPVDQSLGDTIALNYTKYVKTGDMTGTTTTSYNSLVPFAEGTGTISTLVLHAQNNDTYLNGPQSSDQVTCFSCHRGHASAFNYMMRWDPTQTWLVQNGAYLIPSGATSWTTNTVMAGYYDRDVSKFAANQRPLCNKCHAKD